PIRVPVHLTANLVAIAGHEPIPRVAHERKRKEAWKEPPGVTGGPRHRRPLDAVRVTARRPETDAKDLGQRRLDAGACDLWCLNVDSAIRRKHDRVHLVPQGHPHSEDSIFAGSIGGTNVSQERLTVLMSCGSI